MSFLRISWQKFLDWIKYPNACGKWFVVPVVVGIIGVGMIPPVSLLFRRASLLCGAIYIGYILHLISVGRSFWSVVRNVLFVAMVRGCVEYNWLVEPFNFLPNANVWMVYGLGCIAVVAMAFYVGMFTAISAGIVWWIRKRVAWVWERRMAQVALFAVMFAVMEWVRGWLFTGFMWNPIAVMWTWRPKMMAIAYWVGYFGMAVMSVLLLGMGYVLVPYVREQNMRMVKRCAWGIFIGVAIWHGIGIWRVDFMPVKRIGKTVRVIDANIDQRMINNYFSQGRAEAIKTFVAKRYDKLVRASDDWADVDLFVLPETSSMYDLTNNGYMELWYANMNNEKSAMIVGFNRYSDIDFATGDFSVYNSIAVVDKNGVRATYDKMHLVPFGEFVPFRKLLNIGKFTAGGHDFSAGKKRDVLVAGGMRLYPLLCYEAIFEADVPADVDAIVTISNDAWFGEWGKVQHFEMAKFRAVEAGVPLIRAANRGISGIVE